MAAISLVLVLSSIRHLPVVAAPELRDQSATPADAQMQLAAPGNAKYYATDDCVDDTLPPDITEVSCIEADEYILPEPIRDGFYFVEWNTAKDGSGESYAAGESILIRQMTLYAIWDSEEYVIASASNAEKIAETDPVIASEDSPDFDADEADLLDEADTAVFPELEAAELPIKTASPSNADRVETENAM